MLEEKRHKTLVDSSWAVYLERMSLNTEISSVVKAPLGFIGEFKQFISRGNVVDLAVGVIIGGAFGSIVNSLVKDVVMPPVG